MSQLDHDDILAEKYLNDQMLRVARKVLSQEDQTEEDFLGAQGVLMLHGLL